MCRGTKSCSKNRGPKVKKSLYNLRIKTLKIQEYNILKITLTDQTEYTANLSADFSQLFCYPKNLDEWKDAKVNEGAFAIEWKSGFDIHFDQIIAIAIEQKKAG